MVSVLGMSGLGGAAWVSWCLSLQCVSTRVLVSHPFTLIVCIIKCSNDILCWISLVPQNEMASCAPNCWWAQACNPYSFFPLQQAFLISGWGLTRASWRSHLSTSWLTQTATKSEAANSILLKEMQRALDWVVNFSQAFLLPLWIVLHDMGSTKGMP